MGNQALLIQLNGENTEVSDRLTLSDLVGELSLPPARIAIELNKLVVRRDKWAHTILAEGDRIEIVHFVGGGSGGSRTSCPPAGEARSDPRRDCFEKVVRAVRSGGQDVRAPAARFLFPVGAV
ncbi:MAG TPA: sulfur carrier protein ThiS [Pyrinomonadaceae bacterium]|nr:sulfur carrier protein ThiS [Pyrinomonadaceae bacterium]